MESSNIKPYDVSNSFTAISVNSSKRSPLKHLSDLSKNIPEIVNNPFTSSSTLPGGINPFASDGSIRFQQLILGRLQLVLGDNFFDGNNNLFIGGTDDKL